MKKKRDLEAPVGHDAQQTLPPVAPEILQEAAQRTLPDGRTDTLGMLAWQARELADTLEHYSRHFDAFYGNHDAG